MPVKVKCSNCDKVVVAPDAARGKAVKCPECQTRIAVPAEPSPSKSSTKPSSDKTKAKKTSKPVDSEEAFASMDMRRAEDKDARICPKCGFDMKYQDEEDSECPQCGFDSEEGGMGARARKKAMKGPDPADFYPELFKQSWKFVGKNHKLAWRTIMYTLVCLTISLFCAFMYLWISAWPPRWFLALCFSISFLVIPGWMWFLDVEVIKLTLERKDKFKKLNFDFFLASAMGAAFVFWTIAVALPVIAVPGGLGYVLVNFGGMPDYVLPICIALGAIPAVWMLPVVMSHMSMPVQYKGWMVWKVVPMWVKNLKPLSVWFMWFLVTNIPNIAGIALIVALYGADITNIVNSMEFNANIARKIQSAIDNPNARKKGEAAPVQEKLPDPVPVDFIPLIVPGVILVFMSISNGFTCMFNMRTNGQFTYYNKNSLDMIDKLKEYKYKAKERRDEDEDDAPKTTMQLLVDAMVFFLLFDIMGLVGGMLYGSFTDAGVPMGITIGVLMFHVLASWIVQIQCIIFAFQESLMWGFITLFGFYPIGFSVFVFQNWEERKAHFFKVVIAMLGCFMIGFVAGIVGVFALLPGKSTQGNQAQPGQAPPAQVAPNDG